MKPTGLLSRLAFAVARRICSQAGLARLAITPPEPSLRACMLPEGGLEAGLVPELLPKLAPHAAPGMNQYGCVCVGVANRGWKDEASNCILNAMFVGVGSIPTATFCADSASQLATVPHSGKREFILCLVDRDTQEAIFCTWSFPVARRPADAVWQMRVPLGAPMHVFFKVTADNARSVLCDSYIEIGKAPPHTLKVVTWRTMTDKN